MLVVHTGGQGTKGLLKYKYPQQAGVYFENINNRPLAEYICKKIPKSNQTVKEAHTAPQPPPSFGSNRNLLEHNLAKIRRLP
jgi:hypothetical protein